MSPVTNEQRCGLGGYVGTVGGFTGEMIESEPTVQIGQKYYYIFGYRPRLFKVIAATPSIRKAIIKECSYAPIVKEVSFGELLNCVRKS